MPHYWTATRRTFRPPFPLPILLQFPEVQRLLGNTAGGILGTYHYLGYQQAKGDKHLDLPVTLNLKNYEELRRLAAAKMAQQAPSSSC